MNKNCIRSLVLAIFSIGIVQQADAAILDQSNETAPHPQVVSKTTQMKEVSQTFTPSVSGPLTDVSLKLGVTSPGGAGTITIDIRDTENASASNGSAFVPALIPGSPDIAPTGGQILATEAFDIGSLDVIDPTIGEAAGFSPLFHFDPAPVLQAGQRYSILMRFQPADTDSSLVWHHSGATSSGINSYASGDFFYRVETDFAWTILKGDLGFRTYMAVPEPSAMLLATALTAIAPLRSLRRK